MDKNARIFVSGHRGLLGSAICRRLREESCRNLILRTRNELDLRNPVAVEAFFASEKPEYVFLAAAKVGGILANDTYPADFLRDNLVIELNVIDLAWRYVSASSAFSALRACIRSLRRSRSARSTC
jgi:GDP-L-fucose synthase